MDDVTSAVLNQFQNTHLHLDNGDNILEVEHEHQASSQKDLYCSKTTQLSDYEQILIGGSNAHHIKDTRTSRCRLRIGRSASHPPTPNLVKTPFVINTFNEPRCRLGTVTDFVCKTGTAPTHSDAAPRVDVWMLELDKRNQCITVIQQLR